MARYDKITALVKGMSIVLDDGTEIWIRPAVEDKLKIISLAGKDFGEESLNEIKAVLFRMIKKADPAEPDENIDNLLALYLMEIYEKSIIALKLLTKEKLNELKTKAEKSDEPKK